MRILAFVLAFLCSPTAFAFSIQLSDNGNPLRWNTHTVPLYLDQDATQDITNGSDMTAVRKALASWNNISCSNLVLNEAGVTASTATIYTTGYLDNKNIIAWIEDDRWELGAWVLGVTTPVFDTSGVIHEADIAMNGFRSEWSTSNTPSNKADVESVTVHELGHFFGAQHVLGGESFSDPPTMSPSVDPHLQTRTLSADDEKVACYLYPKTTYACSSNTDCPRLVGNNPNTGEERYEGRLSCANKTCGTAEPGSEGCRCDTTTACDADCACDPECGDSCACDTTTTCDDDCSCDPECDEGCSAVPSSKTSEAEWAGVGVMLAAIFAWVLSQKAKRAAVSPR